MKFLMLLVASSVLHLGFACDEEVRELDRDLDPVTACQKYLNCLLDKVCTDRVISKRDTATSLDISPDLPEFPYRGIVVGLARRHRSRRQLVHDCCLRSCKVQHLLTHCPDTAVTTQQEFDNHD